MRYIQNITTGNVRVATKIEKTAGGHLHDSVELEPEVVVLKMDPKTKVRTSKPGQNVAMVEDESFDRKEFKASDGVLFTEISEEDYEAREKIISSYHLNRVESNELPGFLSRDHVMKIVDAPKQEEAITRIPMNPDTLELEFVGAEHGTQSRPDPAEGGKTLSEVRRSEGAEGKEVDQSILDQMGK